MPISHHIHRMMSNSLLLPTFYMDYISLLISTKSEFSHQSIDIGLNCMIKGILRCFTVGVPVPVYPPPVSMALSIEEVGHNAVFPMYAPALGRVYNTGYLISAGCLQEGLEALDALVNGHLLMPEIDTPEA